MNDAIISGYLTLTPLKSTPVVYQPLSPSKLPEPDSATPTAPNESAGDESAGPQGLTNATTSGKQWKHPFPRQGSTYVTLSVPYQGSSRDYSSLGGSSLALLPTVEPTINAKAAKSLDRSLSVCCCGSSGAYVYTNRCASDRKANGTIRISEYSFLAGYNPTFAVPLLRPVKSIRIQILNPQGDLLGFSDEYGPCSSVVPLGLGFVPNELCGAGLAFNGKYKTPAGQTQRMQAGQSYNFKLELTPFLAAGDSLTGRSAGRNYVVDVNGILKVTR